MKIFGGEVIDRKSVHLTAKKCPSTNVIEGQLK